MRRTKTLVNGPDLKNLVIGTIHGGNFYHIIFFESGHLYGVRGKSRWTYQSGSLIGKMRCHGNQVSNFGDDIKMLYLSNH